MQWCFEKPSKFNEVHEELRDKDWADGGCVIDSEVDGAELGELWAEPRDKIFYDKGWVEWEKVRKREAVILCEDRGLRVAEWILVW